MSPWLSDLFLNSQSDERLVRLAGDGHQQAFTAIVERYRRELSRFAGRLSSDGRAEDVVQQTFLSAFAALQNGSEVKHLRGWLYTILRHHAARASDRSYAESEIRDVALVGASLEESAAQRMSAFDALSEINRLPDRQRTALVATAIEGRSRAEVAGLLGLSEGAVRQLVHRARSSVRAAVTAITPFPLLRWLMARQPTGSDWTKAELMAGAGSASTAVAAKFGAVVIAGLGLAGAIAVRPQAGHPRAPVPAASSSSSRASGSAGDRVALTGPGGLAAARVADPSGGIAGAVVGLGTAAAQTGGLAAAPGAPGGGSILTRRDGGGEGGGGRDSSGSSGSDGGDHGGSPVGFSGGDGGSSSGSSGDGGSGGGSGSSDGGSGGGTASVTSGSSDGGGSTSSGTGSSDGGSSTSGSSGSDGGSSGGSDGGTLSGGSLDGGSGGGSDGGVLSSGSTSGHGSGGG